MKAALLLLALCALGHAQAQIKLTCQALTNKVGCAECRRNTCLYCTKGFGETWSGSGASLQVASCTQGTPKACGLPVPDGCAKCVPAPGNLPTCIECITTPNPINVPAGGKVTFQRYSHYLSWKGANFGKCVKGLKSDVIGHTNCLEYNADDTCKLCKSHNVPGNQQGLVVPVNAIFTNGVNPMSLCKNRVEISGLSRAAVGQDMTITGHIPADCVEVNTAFRCARCRPNFALTTTAQSAKCTAATAAQKAQKKNANGCLTAKPFQEYCQSCNAAGTLCTKCVLGRDMGVKGYCSLNCKQLFGITCLTCTNDRCLSNDPAFPNGRR